ncbi:TOBE domain-containing protein [Modicisalibacter luteus]|uniref:TOBE domain-containing protein n=1 Tax=Modicisalibacter luteus TaxID=453962 RepID=UPI0036397C74
MPPGYNRLEGIVKERLYRGSRIEYRLEINGVNLMVVTSNLGQRLHAVGDKVTVSVCPEDLVRVAA